MIEITLSLTPATSAFLHRLVDQTNKAMDAHYSLPEWILLHLQELAIADTLGSEVDAIRREEEEAATKRTEERLRRRRDTLIEQLA